MRIPTCLSAALLMLSTFWALSASPISADVAVPDNHLDRDRQPERRIGINQPAGNDAVMRAQGAVPFQFHQVVAGGQQRPSRLMIPQGHLPQVVEGSSGLLPLGGLRTIIAGLALSAGIVSLLLLLVRRSSIPVRYAAAGILLCCTLGYVGLAYADIPPINRPVEPVQAQWNGQWVVLEIVPGGADQPIVLINHVRENALLDDVEKEVLNPYGSVPGAVNGVPVAPPGSIAPPDAGSGFPQSGGASGGFGGAPQPTDGASAGGGN